MLVVFFFCEMEPVQVNRVAAGEGLLELWEGKREGE
jgi:hypothetical protein